MADAEQGLADHAFFADLAAVFRPALGPCAKMANFSAGQYLFHEGDPADWFYLIHGGRVALQISAPARQPIIFQTLGANDVLGIYWLMPQSHWTHDACALDFTTTVAIEAACLRQKCAEDPALGYDLLKRFVPILLHRLESAQLQLLDVYAHPK